MHAYIFVYILCILNLRMQLVFGQQEIYVNVYKNQLFVSYIVPYHNGCQSKYHVITTV